jgi:ACT domain-containing protein
LKESYVIWQKEVAPVLYKVKTSVLSFRYNRDSKIISSLQKRTGVLAQVKTALTKSVINFLNKHTKPFF